MRHEPVKGSSAGQTVECTWKMQEMYRKGQAYCGRYVKGLGQQKWKRKRDRNAGNQERHDRRRGMFPASGGAEAGRDSRMGVDRSVRPADRSSAGSCHYNNQRFTLNQRHKEVKKWAI